MKKYIEIDVELLSPSPTNPRKAFGDLNDLAASIKAQGVLEPLIVRAIGEKFEIIAGERRFKAAKQIGLDKVPCVVHDLKDEEVLEVQIIENMQRSDLSPMEEAEGYKILHDEKGISFDDLALRIGKSKNYIYTRLRLLSLIPEARKMLAEGKMPISYADQLTRVTDVNQQKHLFKLMDNGRFSDLADLKDAVANNYLLQIKNAPFNTNHDIKVHQIGPCSKCEKRTGADKDLFGDAGKLDSCLDPKCWAKRKELYVKEHIETYKSKGITVLTGEKAQKIASNSWNYEKVSGTSGSLKNGVTWKNALKGVESKAVIAFEDSSGKIVEVVEEKVALKYVPKELISKSKKEKEDPKVTAQRDKEKRDKEVRIAFGKVVAQAVSEKIKKNGIPSGLIRILIELLTGAGDSGYYDTGSSNKFAIANSGLAFGEKNHCVSLANVSDKDLGVLIPYLIVGNAIAGYNSSDKPVKELAELFKLNVKNLKDVAVSSLNKKKEAA